MVLHCRDYRQAMRWARPERKTYKIPEPDTGFLANEEFRDLPLFLQPDRNWFCSQGYAAMRSVGWMEACRNCPDAEFQAQAWTLFMASLLLLGGGDG
jgi:hypothetical protein